MANIWEKAVLILAGNLNSGLSYLITTVMLTVIFPDEDVLYMSTPPNLGSDLSKKSAFFQLFRPKVQFNLAEIASSRPYIFFQSQVQEPRNDWKVFFEVLFFQFPNQKLKFSINGVLIIKSLICRYYKRQWKGNRSKLIGNKIFSSSLRLPRADQHTEHGVTLT